jgi:hypothetical protein
LGKESTISSDFVSPELTDAGGHDVVPCGVIDLDWKWHPRGTRVHQCRFYVFSTSDHLDVLFGVEYIVNEGLLIVNESAMAPLTEHKKLTKGELGVNILKYRKADNYSLTY